MVRVDLNKHMPGSKVVFNMSSIFKAVLMAKSDKLFVIFTLS